MKLLLLVLILLSAPGTGVAEQPFSVHTVAAGETLAAIAGRYGASPGDITSANGLAGEEKLPPAGTVMLIPGSLYTKRAGRFLLYTIFFLTSGALAFGVCSEYFFWDEFHSDPFVDDVTDEPRFRKAAKERGHDTKRRMRKLLLLAVSALALLPTPAAAELHRRAGLGVTMPPDRQAGDGVAVGEVVPASTAAGAGNR